MTGMIRSFFQKEEVLRCPFPRPPGAIDEGAFLRSCDRCDACVEACPHGAIGIMPAGSGVFAGTPALNPATAPCHLCEDLACVAACDRGALVPVPKEAIFLGLAEIDKTRCFAFQGPECGTCATVCPLAAIRVDQGRPEIDQEICNGCGLCRQACPVWGKAIDCHPG